MKNRDDFPIRVKELIAKRSGTLCSNPSCNVLTYGPGQDPSKSANRGVAAHITAAAPDGPRYDSSLTPEKRRSADNGIWLCQNCAKVVDNDEDRYTADLLRYWKKNAEERAQRALANPRIAYFGPDFASTFVVVTRQREAPAIDYTILKPGESARKKITLHPISVPRQLIDPWVPVICDPKQVRPGVCLITVTCQNQGTGVDQNIKIDFRIDKKGMIHGVATDQPNRMEVISGGQPSSSYVSFAVRNLLPNEYQGARIWASDRAHFAVDLWSQNSGKSPEVFIYDVSFGEAEKVPPPKFREKPPDV